MHSGMVTVGLILIVAGLLGYMYADNQPDLDQQPEMAPDNMGMDWRLIRTVSAAGTLTGLVLLVVGAIPDTHDYEEETV